jgi:hypothetical protein
LWRVTFLLVVVDELVAFATLVVDVVLELLELPQPAIPTAATITASNVRFISPTAPVVALDSPPPG